MRRELFADAVERGVDPVAAGRVLGIARSTAFKWAGLMRERGRAGLAVPALDRSGRRKLTLTQESELASVITDTDPRELGYASALWTTPIVADMVARRWGITYTPRGIGIVLRRRGLSPQRPIVRAQEGDPDAQQAWREQTYPQIAEQAAATGATVVFADEASVRTDYHAGTTWAPVGRTPIVAGTGARLSVNTFSAVTAAGTLIFEQAPGRVNAAAFTAFLGVLMTAVAGPVIAVVDGHPAHRAKATATFVAEHADRLAVRFLPGYSPHLNPDEWVWKNLKHDVVGRLAPRSLAEMKTAITAGVQRLHENSGIVRGFFPDPDLAYITQADQQIHSKSTTRVRA